MESRKLPKLRLWERNHTEEPRLPLVPENSLIDGMTSCVTQHINQSQGIEDEGINLSGNGNIISFSQSEDTDAELTHSLTLPR